VLGPGFFFNFVIFFFNTVGRTSWTSDHSVARPLPKHRSTQTQNKRTHRHPCLERDSKPRSQCSSERRQFIPQTVGPLWSALSSIPNSISENEFVSIGGCRGGEVPTHLGPSERTNSSHWT
jgi:hypothetical protein